MTFLYTLSMGSHDWQIDKLQTSNILYRIEDTVQKICITENGLNLKDHLECGKLKFVTFMNAYHVLYSDGKSTLSSQKNKIYKNFKNNDILILEHSSDFSVETQSVYC